MAVVVDTVVRGLCSPLALHALLVFVVTFIGFRIIAAYFFSPLRKIPGSLAARTTSKWLEQATIRGKMADFGLRGMLAYGDIFVSQPQSVCLSDPADIRTVLSTPSFVKSPYYRVLQFTGIDSIMSTSEPHRVSLKRRMLGPYFTTSYLNKMEPIVVEHGARAIVDRWRTLIDQSITGRINANYEMTYSMCTYNIISRLVYGHEGIAALDPKNPETSLKWMSDATTYMSARALLQLLPRPIFRLITLPWEHMYDQFASHVHKSIATRKDLLLEIDNLNSEKGGQEQKGRPVDLLQALLDCQDPESKVHLNGPQIHAESLLLLIGGIDPTAYTLTWTTHLFMLYPECYRRAVNEVRQRFPLSDLETTPEISYAMAKASLPYLEACIYESMRLVPVPHMLIPRVVPEEGTTIKDHFIPGGSTVFCNILGSHLNPKYWQDPHRFSPERFLDPATRRTAIHSVFTFGYGNRICLGKHLAWLNMTTILANLLRRFDFKLPDGYTRTGPNIIDPDTGHPKLMDKTEFITAKPVDYVKDCALVITAAQV